MLNTVPVGVPLGPSGSPGVGMLTTSGLMAIGVPFWPGVLYRVDTPGVVVRDPEGAAALSEMPQGLTRLGSGDCGHPRQVGHQVGLQHVPLLWPLSRRNAHVAQQAAAFEVVTEGRNDFLMRFVRASSWSLSVGVFLA